MALICVRKARGLFVVTSPRDAGADAAPVPYSSVRSDAAVSQL